MLDDDVSFLSSHDHNFKNLKVDYPLQAIEFFAHEVFPKIEGNPKVMPLRQEQQKDNLADRYRALDTPIKLEWPNGEKAIVVFALEAESNPYDFDAIRLAHYCLDLAKQHKTNRVVPVVVFTSAGKYQKGLQLGTEKMTTMQFDFIACQLSQLDYKQWRDSENIVARLTLPLMNYPEEERLEVVHKSTQGLLSLEPSKAFQGKYLPFITHYANLDETDIIEYQQRYPQESEIMLTYTQRLWQEGKQEGVQLGRQEGRLEGKREGIGQGERELLLKQLKRRFAKKATRVYEAKVMQANSIDIERWAINILDAKTIEEVFS